jgi:hypothetical protein
VAGCCDHGSEPSGYIKQGEGFLDRLSLCPAGGQYYVWKKWGTSPEFGNNRELEEKT